MSSGVISMENVFDPFGVPKMSKIVPFDTLAYAKKLERSGVSIKQAEAQAEALADVLDHNYVPISSFQTTAERILQEFNLLRKEMHAESSQVKTDILRWVVSLLLGQTALLITAVKLIH